MVANSFASSDGGKIIDLPGTYQLLKTLRLQNRQYIAAIYQSKG